MACYADIARVADAGWRGYLRTPLEVFDGAIVIVSCGSVTSHRWVNLNMLRMFRHGPCCCLKSPGQHVAQCGCTLWSSAVDHGAVSWIALLRCGHTSCKAATTCWSCKHVAQGSVLVACPPHTPCNG